MDYVESTNLIGSRIIQYSLIINYRTSLILRRSEVARSHSQEGVKASDLGPSGNQVTILLALSFKSKIFAAAVVSMKTVVCSP